MDYPGIAFIFDMDGTLVDNMGFHARAWYEFLHGEGFALDADEVTRRIAGGTNIEILRSFFGPARSDADLIDLARRKEETYRALYSPHLRPISGLEAFLKQVEVRGIRFALATASGPQNIDFVLRGTGLTNTFKVIVNAQDVKHGKPHPEAFLTAAARLNVVPDQCIVFEDSLAGFEAAHRAGMRAVGITTSHPAEKIRALPGVIRVIDSYDELDIEDLLMAGE